MSTTDIILIAVGAYLLGSVPLALLLGRAIAFGQRDSQPRQTQDFINSDFSPEWDQPTPK